MTEQETLYVMALTMALRHQPKVQRTLFDVLGSGQVIYECRHDLGRRFESLSSRIAENVLLMDGFLPQCEAELAYIRKHKIRILGITDDDYPARLRQCEDAPLLLYTLGALDLNAPHVLGIVGTRRCTERGRDLCTSLIKGLSKAVPDALIISGLAYGIDVAAHRGALATGMPTAGVLAHGLDELYPRSHRQTAIEMLARGGLVTEFTSHTPVERLNFLQRNRLVAGMADAVVVVESPQRGGSLNTARLAAEYNRDVFAFPGRPTDVSSEGCNLLIRRNGAALITCAEDVLDDLGWQQTSPCPDAQQLLFPELTAEEQQIVDVMSRSDDDIELADLSHALSLPPYKLTPLMLTLELKGVVRVLSGGRYHLVH